MSTSLGDRRVVVSPRVSVPITDPKGAAASQGGAHRVLPCSLPCVTVLALALATTFAGLFGWSYTEWRSYEDSPCHSLAEVVWEEFEEGKEYKLIITDRIMHVVQNTLDDPCHETYKKHYPSASALDGRRLQPTSVTMAGNRVCTSSDKGTKTCYVGEEKGTCGVSKAPQWNYRCCIHGLGGAYGHTCSDTQLPGEMCWQDQDCVNYGRCTYNKVCKAGSPVGSSCSNSEDCTSNAICNLNNKCQRCDLSQFTGTFRETCESCTVTRLQKQCQLTCQCKVKVYEGEETQSTTYMLKPDDDSPITLQNW